MKKYFDTQLEFQKKIYDIDKMSNEDRTRYSKEYILAAHKELSEVLDCLDWKTHRKEQKTFSRTNFGEEIVDVFKYIINICLMWNITADEFDKLFDDKTSVVLQRFKQEYMNSAPDEKVCAIDLDDVLNEWHTFIVDTFNKEKGTNHVTDKEIREKTNTLEYKDFKHNFRESGIKINIPARRDASSFTKYLKEKGYRIVIISSRPYKQYSRIFSDTINWLKKNNIEFDDLYFDEQKHIKILKLFPNLSFMVEDNNKYATDVAKEGYKVFFMNNGFEKCPESENITIVHSLDEIKKYV